MQKILLPLLLCASLRGAAQLPVIVSDLNPGPDNSAPFNLAVFKNRLCFAATTPGRGAELWNYDGGGAPLAVPEVNAGSGDGPAPLTYTAPVELNGRLYFAATNAGGAGLELWQYDGVNAPALAQDVNPGTAASQPAGFALYGNRLFFSATKAGAGRELCAYDGGVGPVALYDVMPGAGSSEPTSLLVFNGKLYFSAAWPGSGTELCVYDSSTNAVTLAADIVPGAIGSSITGMVAVGNQLYFTAAGSGTGRELWRYDGTTASLVKDLLPGPGSGVIGAWLAVYGGDVYFGGATSLPDYRLYRYKPAADTVEEVAVVNPAGSLLFAWPLVFNSKLYFAATDGSNGVELWQYDGVSAGMVSDLNPGGNASDPAWLCSFGGGLYFSAAGSDATGRELYRLQSSGGVQNVAFDGSAAVVPNPAPGDAQLLLSLRQPRRCGFSLTDVSGRTVWQQPEALYGTGAHRIQLPVAALAPGLYFYAVREGGRLLVSGRLEKR